MTVSSYTGSPTARLLIAIFVAMALVVPIVAVWALIYGREQQSQIAQQSITEGWGGPQVVAGPVLVVPYRTTREETVTENGASVTRQVEHWEQRTIAPEAVELTTDLTPERRTRSIYEAIVYEADTRGTARFAMPADLQRYGMDPGRFDLARAELRFSLSDPAGLGANPNVSVGGQALRLQPGGGTGRGTGGVRGFFAWLDAGTLATGPIEVRFAFSLRGNRSLSVVPQAGDTRWTVASSWPHPSFQGNFLPATRDVSAEGFRATYQVGNLALGQSLVSQGGVLTRAAPPPSDAGTYDTEVVPSPGVPAAAQIDLIQPVDLYDQTARATKYGFLFIGFTFLALLLFDIVGGARVRAAEYLLVGIGLVLFFVLLLAFAEVIGFAWAYILASGAITGLNTFYSASVLKSWRRAFAITALMITLYAMLYLLLSLEAYSLLIGSLLLFATLALVMYLTRNLNWGGEPDAETQPA